MFSFSKDIGMDLGTANTLVFMKGKGIILREPSVVAVDTRKDEVLYVGQEAKEVIGKTPGSIVAMRPLKDGVIADFDITANMMQRFIKKVCGSSIFSHPNIIICIRPGSPTSSDAPSARRPWRPAAGGFRSLRSRWPRQSARACPWPRQPAAWSWISAAAPARSP